MDYKYLDKAFNIILGIGITDLLMNSLLCNVFSKNIKSIFIQMSKKDVGILFFKTVWCFGMQFKLFEENYEFSKIDNSCVRNTWFRLCYD